MSAMYANLLLASCWASLASTAATRRYTQESLESCLARVIPDTERVHLANETGYFSDVVRPYNLNFQFVPISVVYPLTTIEVSETVKCAARFSRKVQARSGGHDYINKAIGGANGSVIIDLNNFQQLEVDDNGVATVGPGNVLKAAVRGLHEKGGWYMSHGSFPTVGLGGHAIVGGLGMTSRENGPTLDAMIEAQVVLANGSVVVASTSCNPDLFWAIRGAGSNFGVITEFKFQAKQEPAQVHSFTYALKSTNASVLADAFKVYHAFASNPELTTALGINAIITNGSLILTGAYRGSEADFRALDIKNQLPGAIVASEKTNISWIEHMEATFESLSAQHVNQSYFHSRDTALTYDTIPSNESIDNLFHHLQYAENGATGWSAMFDLQNGAANSKPIDATAYPHRNSLYFFNIMIYTEGPTTNVTYSYVDEAMLAIQGGQRDGYLSYVGTPAFGVPSDVFYGQNLQRLRDIKATLDPTDVFSTPTGIKP